MIAVRPSSLSLLLVSCLACSTAARRDAAPPATKTDAAPASQEPSTSPEEPTAASHDAATTPTWIDPLPPLVLTALDEAQQARSRACFEGHDVGSPSPTPAAMMAAAECVAAIPAPGNEIRLYEVLVQTHPNAPETLEATRRLGTRLEQLDLRPGAIDAYATYLRRYPKQADARALAQRGVCLARSLGDAQRVDDLLTELERLYGPHGFTRPSEAALEPLCAPLPPVAPRP